MIDNLFEICMLLCFAAAWPFSIYKGLKTGSSNGKSIVFSVVILMGYVCGVINKMVMGQVNYVVFFYCLGFALVFTDLMIVLHNRSVENRAGSV